MAWSVEKKYGNLPRRRPEDPFERIWAHYHDLSIDVVLSENEKSRLKIYEFAIRQYEKGFTDGEIAKSIIVNYSEDETKKIAPRTAYRYIQDAKDIFGTLENLDLDFEKRIAINRCKMALRKCEKAENWSAWSTINQSLIKIYDFNKNNDELMEFLKTQKPIQIILSADPEVLRKQALDLVEDVEDAQIVEEDGNETA